MITNLRMELFEALVAGRYLADLLAGGGEHLDLEVELRAVGRGDQQLHGVAQEGRLHLDRANLASAVIGKISGSR